MFIWHKVNDRNPVSPPEGKPLLLYSEGMYFMGKFRNGRFMEMNVWDYPQWWTDVFQSGTMQEFDALRPHMTPENEPDGWTLKYFERKAAKARGEQ